ncbi:MAG: fructosamine kinase family protein [Ignavibacteriales bacterium]|nr:MAG: fructosamine kinase family protein [Ignavibacteriaceae bacterium]MBW7872431.1 fructosamine kinase family protein [Ignavibacteria bacterium]MCZ2143649.1 fructosamine kinase family protein [Ignavibacteriales bacterium]OQY69897.1 MAG: hypothetical protein B6D45_12110 [Ignavibacteriales bacterium UTCHB3]MBV6445421.1 hypothetical protein [Ignavibacteriaceae bacterium]
MKKLAERLIGKKVSGIKPAGGGCIAEAVVLTMENGLKYFVKKYTGSFAEETVKAEVTGLEEIEKSKTIRTPKVIASEGSAIVLEYIQTGEAKKDFWEVFGQKLAQMHRMVSEKGHGFHSDNFIGATPQKNIPFNPSWSEFFINNRMVPQFSLMKRNGYYTPDFSHKVERFLEKLPDLFEDENTPPSLLHGDLWSGNFMISAEGEAVIFDPAVYYGDRETDLAMARLFGGFSERFYAAYAESYPLNPGWQEREIVYQIYHRVNHVNLFGSGYLGGVVSALNYF